MKEETKIRRQKSAKIEEPAICEICFDKESPGVTNDSGHTFITCDKCDIAVHRRCHGISRSSPDTKHFICDKCLTKSKKEKFCMICERREGYLKKLEKGKWIHPVCALLTDDIEVTDFAQMKFSLLRPLSPQGTVPQCEYCESSSSLL